MLFVTIRSKAFSCAFSVYSIHCKCVLDLDVFFTSCRFSETLVLVWLGAGVSSGIFAPFQIKICNSCPGFGFCHWFLLDLFRDCILLGIRHSGEIDLVIIILSFQSFSLSMFGDNILTHSRSTVFCKFHACCDRFGGQIFIVWTVFSLDSRWACCQSDFQY